MLAELIRSDLRNKRYLPAVGHSFATRALDLFPRASLARIVIQPYAPHKSSLEKYHIKLVKNSAFDVQLVYMTAWIGIALVGSSTQTIRIRITSCHHAGSLRQQKWTNDPLIINRHEDSQYQDLVRYYPAFRAHHSIFKSMLTSKHESLQSLASGSCVRAFELIDDLQCEYLHTVSCEIMQAPSQRSRHSNKSSPAPLNPRFKDAHTALRFGLSRQQYERSLCATREPNGTFSAISRAYVALGSNVGDRMMMIETSCQEMNKRCIKVLRTSHLYETEPMYVKTQQPFINGVCEASVPLLPSSG